MIRILALCVSLALIQSCCAWGEDGHEMVAAVAKNRLNSRAKAEITKLLPEVDGDIVKIATWADEFRIDNPWSFTYHFVNTPDYACKFRYLTDCVNDACVVGALFNYTSILDRYILGDPSIPRDEATTALKFVVHFHGDIHQPMHVSFKSDEGGNLYPVTFYNKTTQMHGLFDYEMIERRIELEFPEGMYQYAAHIESRLGVSPWLDYLRQWESCPNESPCPGLWAEESSKHACDAYYMANANNGLIEDAFYNRFIHLIDERIAMGGVRLATTLNSLWPENQDSLPQPQVLPQAQVLPQHPLIVS
eukprot:TRINITY_DN1497_c0_g1::TRINITY_DN1497_c0_g1_i1::g.27197::m.27197 TRINITY_DN1497_c0_g1::TRINITY_DN1497_c0_g1_i1::g.27197  ORF type:complete len:305 (-),score=55.74,sp/Q9C9G4/ENDO2_ARATH/35.23/3e-56,S1-P1_nuclease/PF02265.11/2.6e-60 TRINITY_DN1497_c0_g1_i1:699-1613(-)